MGSCLPKKPRIPLSNIPPQKSHLVNIIDKKEPLEQRIEGGSIEQKALSLKYKEKGNEFYKQKDFINALGQYTKAIEIFNGESLYFTNRALVHKQMKKWSLVIQDCIQAAGLDQNNIKAFHLKGIAMIEIGKGSTMSFELILQGLDLLKNAKDLTIKAKKAFISDIQTNISKGKKILFLKKQELKDQKTQKTKAFLEGLLPDSAPLKQEALNLLLLNNQSPFIQKTPDYLCCKITYELIKIPFITPDGVSYEGEALKEHCNQMGHFDPVTRNSLYLAPLLKNEALEEAVQDFLEKKPWVFDSEFNLDYKKVLL